MSKATSNESKGETRRAAAAVPDDAWEEVEMMSLTEYKEFYAILESAGISPGGWPPEMLDNLPPEAISMHKQEVLKNLEKILPNWLKEASLTAAPKGANCWICLDGSEEDNPLIRQCSCRGESGWGHLSCIVEYATKQYEKLWQKSIQAKRLEDLQEPFEICFNCKQHFTEDLAVDMAKAFVESTKDFPEYDYRRLVSKLLLAKKYACAHEKEGSLSLAEEVLSAVRIAHSSGKGWRWKYFIMIEVYALKLLGLLSDSPKVQLEHYTAALEILKRNGRDDDSDKPVLAVKALIDSVCVEQEGYGRTGDATKHSSLESCKKRYKITAKEFGKNDIHTITAAHSLIRSLRLNGKLTAAYNLCLETSKTCRRVLGPDNHMTKLMDNTLKGFEKREGIAFLIQDGEEANEKVWVVGHCEDSDEYRISKDHWLSRSARSGWDRTVKPTDLVLYEDTFVACIGLKAGRFNGKRGLVKFYDKEKKRYAVAFEQEALGTQLVKGQNLRVVFFGV